MISMNLPTLRWFSSPKKNEIYQFDKGNFQAHSWKGNGSYFAHHTLKVLPPDATQAEVHEDDNGTLRMNHIFHYFHAVSTNKLSHRYGEALGQLEVFQEISGNKHVLTNNSKPPSDAMAVSITRQGDNAK